MSRTIWIPTLLLICTPFLGCKLNQAQAPSSEPPKVDVSEPVAEPIASYEVFTGRTQAVNYADIRARVTGYLKEASFSEGEDVEENKVLFLIDPGPYEATLNQAKANLALQVAQLEYNERDYARMAAAFNKGGFSQDDVDKSRAALDTSKAAVRAADAAVRTAQINVDFTKVRAPFNGRISRRLVDPGTDVQADATIMASVVQMDPMYAYFDVDERTFLRIRELLPEGKVPADADAKLPVALGYANEAPENFSHIGKLKFGDNKVDPTTGTLRMWGIFDNHKRDLFSGLFIRVRMGIPIDPAEAKRWMYVSEAALGSDQGQKYLFVVRQETREDGSTHDVIDRVNVEVGQRKENVQGKPGILIAVKGLKGDEHIVVSNLQRVRKGTEVKVEKKEMPRAQTTAASLPANIHQASK
jgi:RND family efflux transporter MFP subunit